MSYDIDVRDRGAYSSVIQRLPADLDKRQCRVCRTLKMEDALSQRERGSYHEGRPSNVPKVAGCHDFVNPLTTDQVELKEDSSLDRPDAYVRYSRVV
jgi:hypothetical protein